MNSARPADLSSQGNQPPVSHYRRARGGSQRETGHRPHKPRTLLRFQNSMPICLAFVAPRVREWCPQLIAHAPNYPPKVEDL
jgi:hypothetical protein